MILCERHPATNLYRVEVSGWDKNQAFFVEKSELEWNEDSSKQVVLRHMVPDGAVIFLRLLQPISTSRSHPVAYEAEFISMTPDGQHQFRLYQACPRLDEQGGSTN
jgi:hypothetical protein